MHTDITLMQYLEEVILDEVKDFRVDLEVVEYLGIHILEGHFHDV